MDQNMVSHLLYLLLMQLTKHYQKFKNLGGKLLTGGDNDFYKKIGYDLEIYSLVYKKS